MAAAVTPSVAFVLTSLGIGGAEGQFSRLAMALARRGYHVTVVCLQDDTPTARALRAQGIPVDVCAAASGGTARRSTALLAGFVRVVRRWRRQRPDIVHGVLVHGYLFGGLAAWLVGVSVLVSSRRSLGHFKERQWLLRALEWLVNRRTVLVIANSEAVRHDTLRREGLASDKVIVIPNGLQGDRVAARSRVQVRQAFGVAETTPVAIAVANLIHYKAHDVLVDAWQRVVATVPDAMLWIVGEGPERESITKAIAAAGLSSRVRMLGSRTDVPDLLAAADVLVHPSREEGFSNALLEAMAAGLPVVAANVGGNREAVVAEATGLLVPADDAAGLAEATIRLLVDRDLAHRYGAAGRERVAEHFSEARMIEAYDQVYRRLVRREG